MRHTSKGFSGRSNELVNLRQHLAIVDNPLQVVLDQVRPSFREAFRRVVQYGKALLVVHAYVVQDALVSFPAFRDAHNARLHLDRKAGNQFFKGIQTPPGGMPQDPPDTAR